MKVEKVLRKLQRNGYNISLIDNDLGGWAAVPLKLSMLPEHGDVETTYHGSVDVNAKIFRPTIKGAIRAYIRLNQIDFKDLE